MLRKPLDYRETGVVYPPARRISSGSEPSRSEGMAELVELFMAHIGELDAFV